MSHPKPQRGQRYFLETLRRDAVLSYETDRQSVSQICHSLKVSQTSVYKWIDKYSTLKPQGIQIVEKKDSQAQQLNNLRAELERAHRTIARQTIQLDYHDSLHDYLRTELGVDVKKAESACRPSSGSVSGSASKSDSL